MSLWEKEGIILKAYNTSESAADLEALREVLEAPKISLWGISYGSHLAFEYIRQYENYVEKVVLASLEGPDDTVKLPEYTEAFLLHIAKQATHNYGTTPTYPDLEKQMREVHHRLSLQPVETTYVNRSGRQDTVRISNFELQATIASFYLKNPGDSAKLPKLYTALHAGDFSSIVNQVVIFKQWFFSRLNPMSLAMDLQSGISVGRKQRVAAQMDQYMLGSTINLLLFEWMNAELLPQLPDTFRVLPPNETKALLLSGTLDGRTYIESANAIAQKFKNGTHVLIEHAGHDLYMTSPEVGQLVVDFMMGKEVAVKGLSVPTTPFH